MQAAASSLVRRPLLLRTLCIWSNVCVLCLALSSGCPNNWNVAQVYVALTREEGNQCLVPNLRGPQNWFQKALVPKAGLEPVCVQETSNMKEKI